MPDETNLSPETNPNRRRQGLLGKLRALFRRRPKPPTRIFSNSAEPLPEAEPEPEPKRLQDELEARLLIYLDGEMDPEDAEGLEKLLAADPDLAERRDDLATLRLELSEALHQPEECAETLDDERRRALLAALGGDEETAEGKARATWKRRLLEIAAVLLLFGILASVVVTSLPSFQKVRSAGEDYAAFEEEPVYRSETGDVPETGEAAPEAGPARAPREPLADVAAPENQSSPAERNRRETVEMELRVAPTSVSEDYSAGPPVEREAANEESSDAITAGTPQDFVANYAGMPLGSKPIPAEEARRRLGAARGKAASDAPAPPARRWAQSEFFASSSGEGAVPREEPFAPAPGTARTVPGQAAREISDGAEKKVVSARAKMLYGDLDAAGKDLDEANELAPASPAVAELRSQLSNAQADPTLEDQTKTRDLDLAVLSEVAQQRVEPERRHEILTAEEPFSTFSLNVSDVSFRLAREALLRGRAPEPASVRPEEFINAFDYRDPVEANVDVAFNWEMARVPFLHNRSVLRFAVRANAIGRAEDRPLNLVLQVDGSGSMERADRQEILSNALRALPPQLKETDQLSVVSFARTPRLLADGVPGNHAEVAVEHTLSQVPEGGTNIQAALEASYEIAQRHYRPDAINRIVLLTDGAANLGELSLAELNERAAAGRQQGIALDAFGVGWEGYDDAVLEALTRNSDGRYAFLNRPETAARDFADRLAGALQVAAEDMKVQLEWNPDAVESYRLMGFEKHRLEKEDFRDNSVDAAEIAQAEAGNAVYVIQLKENAIGDLGTLRVRFRDPATGDTLEHAWPLVPPTKIPMLDEASPSLRLAAAAGFFAEQLAGHPLAAAYPLAALSPIIDGLAAAFPNQPEVADFVSMFQQARQLVTDREPAKLHPVQMPGF